MATLTICDCCNTPLRKGLRVRVVETHPHKGDELEREADICFRCGERMELLFHGPLPKYLAPPEEEEEEAAE